MRNIFKKLISTICVLSCFNFVVDLGNLKSFAFEPVKKADIAFVGFAGTGKSALRSRLIHQDFDFIQRTKTTFSSRVLAELTVDGNIINCNLWDTPGDLRVKEQVINTRTRNADIVVILIDLSLDYQSTIRRSLLEWEKQISDVNPGAKIILAGTKVDLLTDEERQEAERKMKAYTDAVRDLGGSTKSVLISSLEGTNIDKLVDIIKEDIREIGIDNLSIPNITTDDDKYGPDRVPDRVPDRRRTSIFDDCIIM